MGEGVNDNVMFLTQFDASLFEQLCKLFQLLEISGVVGAGLGLGQSAQGRRRRRVQVVVGRLGLSTVLGMMGRRGRADRPRGLTGTVADRRVLMAVGHVLGLLDLLELERRLRERLVDLRLTRSGLLTE